MAPKPAAKKPAAKKPAAKTIKKPAAKKPAAEQKDLLVCPQCTIPLTPPSEENGDATLCDDDRRVRRVPPVSSTSRGRARACGGTCALRRGHGPCVSGVVSLHLDARPAAGPPRVCTLGERPRQQPPESPSVHRGAGHILF